MLQEREKEKDAERNNYKSPKQNKTSGTLCLGSQLDEEIPPTHPGHLSPYQENSRTVRVEGKRTEGGKVRKQMWEMGVMANQAPGD